MSKTIQPAPTKKISHKESFEFCYLRHRYLRKIENSPSQDEMKPYLSIAKHLAKNTYFTYKNLFRIIGFDCDDLISIANIHLVSFLGLFSLEKMPEKYEEFISSHYLKHLSHASDFDVRNKNKANCTIFLKQRMEDVVRVCRQKARNIKGLPTEEYFFYYGPNRPPRILRNLIENYEKYGFRKLDTAIYKSIKKKVKIDDSLIFTLNGNYYVAVPVEQKNLSLSDFSGADLDPYDNIHNMNPEQAFSIVEEHKIWEQRQKEFNDVDLSNKAFLIKRFIENNKKKPKFKEELKAARKLLKHIGD